jgi:dTDP-4-dehydrorhamnose reductase
VAYLCAAVAALRDCRNEPERTAKVNVRNTVALAKTLAANGTRIVFPSTSLVFDGSHPFARADEPVCPRTEYGRQKAEAERQLLALGELTCIVRLTKVIGPEMPLLKGWVDALQKGEAIHPFSDVVMSPLSLPFVAEVLCRTAESGVSGIVQVSGNTDITYEQAARYVAGRIGAKEDLVQPVESGNSGTNLEFVPSHTTLDTSRLSGVLGLATPDVWPALDFVLTQTGQTTCHCRR